MCNISTISDLKRLTSADMDQLNLRRVELENLELGLAVLRGEGNARVIFIWEIDLEEVRRADKKAYKILLDCSFWGSAPIPEYLLKETASMSNEEFREAVSAAADFSLLAPFGVDGGSDSSCSFDYYTMHSLIQRSILTYRIEPESIHGRLVKLSQVIREFTPAQFEALSSGVAVTNSPIITELLPHVQALVNHICTFEDLDPQCEEVFEFARKAALVFKDPSAEGLRG
eukprot:m.1227 g.1227  ORF g.1227 m.1227 type:complete len:229 (+) comp5903_c0_seq1:1109-1795(+)